MSKVENLMNMLMAFNRKERYHVIRNTITGGPFSLNDEFRYKLNRELNLSVPDNAYVAVDYHLDWISAAYWLAAKGAQRSWKNTTEYKNYPGPKSDPIIAGNQEDIDLLVAYPDGDQVILIMIEAKADSGRVEPQIKSKSKRLINIFGVEGTSKKLIRPYFALLGPKSIIPKQEIVDLCPNWFFKSNNRADGIPFIELKPNIQLYAPTRTNSIKENGKTIYKNWKIQKTTKFEPQSND